MAASMFVFQSPSTIGKRKELGTRIMLRLHSPFRELRPGNGDEKVRCEATAYAWLQKIAQVFQFVIFMALQCSLRKHLSTLKIDHASNDGFRPYEFDCYHGSMVQILLDTSHQEAKGEMRLIANSFKCRPDTFGLDRILYH
ncbi:uncharacterized protein CIMG_11543 [Coccidioides immitis RS]|uniref:Uncharacterized protein n=1 Tax=Coccidioides immitis (strain RS) TaxID=246410 RepID=A0A0D8JV41_COCIM|nr:uncharacterized protein CIMG_11543 [Coccidioides immitis RS]KJF61162.1 hypothetical protein CIMG_11543 [Coccidioides immitis RS]